MSKKKTPILFNTINKTINFSSKKDPSYVRLNDLQYKQNHWEKGTGRIPVEMLKLAAKAMPAAKCIRRLQQAVCLMKWNIIPREKELGIDKAQLLEKSLRNPNIDLGQNTYKKLINAAIKDMLVLGFSAIQREKGRDRPFYLWAIDASCIFYNQDWMPHSKEPRYFFKKDKQEFHLYDRNLFLIQGDSATDEIIPCSPTEIAFPFIASWVALKEFQDKNVSSSGIREFLHAGELSQEELYALREYWYNEQENDSRLILIGGKGELKRVSLNAASDSELLLNYEENLLRTIAACYNLTRGDLNLENQTYATAHESALQSYQQGVIPLASDIASHLQTEVLDFYEEEGAFEFHYVDTEKRTEEQEAQRATTLFNSGIITKNEAREAVGIKPLGKIGDVFVNGSGLTLDKEPEDEASEINTSFMPTAKEDGQMGSETVGEDDPYDLFGDNDLSFFFQEDE